MKICMENTCLYSCVYSANINRLIGLLGRVFTNDLGGLGSILGRFVPKT